MKNINLTKLVKGLLAASLLLTVLIACGKKDDNTAQINAFTQSCVNCEGITGFPFFTAQTKASLYSSYSYGYGSQAAMTLNWSFSGQNINSTTQQQGQTQPNYQYGSPAMNYVGKVSAAGQVTVTSAIGGTNNGYFCPAIPAGTYTLATQTVGQWTNGQISGLKLVISGPVSMTASLSQAQASQYNSYQQYSSGSSYISGGLIIEQVSGFYCQGLQFYMN